jgi:hypothetical protein
MKSTMPEVSQVETIKFAKDPLIPNSLNAFVIASFNQTTRAVTFLDHQTYRDGCFTLPADLSFNEDTVRMIVQCSACPSTELSIHEGRMPSGRNTDWGLRIYNGLQAMAPARTLQGKTTAELDECYSAFMQTFKISVVLPVEDLRMAMIASYAGPLLVELTNWLRALESAYDTPPRHRARRQHGEAIHV